MRALRRKGRRACLKINIAISLKYIASVMRLVRYAAVLMLRELRNWEFLKL